MCFSQRRIGPVKSVYAIERTPQPPLPKDIPPYACKKPPIKMFTLVGLTGLFCSWLVHPSLDEPAAPHKSSSGPDDSSTKDKGIDSPSIEDLEPIPEKDKSDESRDQNLDLPPGAGESNEDVAQNSTNDQNTECVSNTNQSFLTKASNYIIGSLLDFSLETNTDLQFDSSVSSEGLTKKDANEVGSEGTNKDAYEEKNKISDITENTENTFNKPEKSTSEANVADLSLNSTLDRDSGQNTNEVEDTNSNKNNSDLNSAEEENLRPKIRSRYEY